MEKTEKAIEWTSQIGQDEFAFNALGQKQNGYFLEIGAFDGVKSSNTLIPRPCQGTSPAYAMLSTKCVISLLHFKIGHNSHYYSRLFF